jgi:hypothetical protein
MEHDDPSEMAQHQPNAPTSPDDELGEDPVTLAHRTRLAIVATTLSTLPDDWTSTDP